MISTIPIRTQLTKSKSNSRKCQNHRHGVSHLNQHCHPLHQWDAWMELLVISLVVPLHSLHDTRNDILIWCRENKLRVFKISSIGVRIQFKVIDQYHFSTSTVQNYFGKVSLYPKDVKVWDFLNWMILNFYMYLYRDDLNLKFILAYS